jgi:hypothetical protein
MTMSDDDFCDELKRIIEEEERKAAERDAHGE